MQVKEYALYKGEELLAMGTKREIAEQLGVSVNSISHYFKLSMRLQMATLLTRQTSFGIG